MDQEYQTLLDQLTIDQNSLGIELRYKCDDPDTGYRIVLTDQDEMDQFDTPFMKIDRPAVFNINDFEFDPEKNLQQIIEFFVTTAYELEKESLLIQKPDEFYPEIYKYIKDGRVFLDALHDNVDIPRSGSKLFTIVMSFITLLVHTELNTDKSSGLGILSTMSSSTH